MAPEASDASRNRPDFWNALWISPPERVSSRGVCCTSTLAIACCSAGGKPFDEAAALRLANNGARLCCAVAAFSDATETAMRSSGVSGSFAAAIVAAGLTGAFGATLAASFVVVPVLAPAAAVPCPTICSRTTPSCGCDTASCRFCPGVSATSVSTSIERLAIAIRTRLSASTLSTCAGTTVPGCSTTPSLAPPTFGAAITGTVGLTGVIAMARKANADGVNLSLTGALQRLQNRHRSLEIELPHRAARGHFLVLTPLLGVEILVHVGGRPDFSGIARALMQREREQRRPRQRRHHMQRRHRPGIARQCVARCGDRLL